MPTTLDRSKQRRGIDAFITQFDRGLRGMLHNNTQQERARPGPATRPTDQSLSAAEKQEAIRLMRVNHAGEIAAQALYQGQALTARNSATKAQLNQAAKEEGDHLAWCAERIHELGGQTSRLQPFWYAGSFAIGAAAGLLGDRVSLGFVAETERQVVDHLQDHLTRLPAEDKVSRSIVSQMQQDEAEHGAQAEHAGGVPLPRPVRDAMKLASKVMTKTAYRI